MALVTRFGAFAGIAAAASMAVTPAFAAEPPTGLVKNSAGSAVFMKFDSTTYNGDTDITEWRRGWGRRGWRRGWRRRGIRGGDVLAGVLILGGIAAVASAASNNRRRDRDVVIVERDRYRDRDYDRRDRRDDRRVVRNDGSSGLDNAVSQCLDRIQEDVRVDSVESVNRTAGGWQVSGSLFNGSGFLCRIDNSGRIDSIDYGNFDTTDFGGSFGETTVDGTLFEGGSQSAAAGQLNDRTYLAAREARGIQAPALQGASEQLAQASDRLPAYPGGPVPGEIYDEIDGDLRN
ncbi:MAG: hypothetical protein AAF941_00835 [Pseudomonadota bacterium]